MDSDIELAVIAAENHGVFTIAEAERLGLAERTVRHRCDRGRYERLYHGVYAFAGSVDSEERRMVAAAKSLGDLAAISHQSAAELWGLARRRISRHEVVARRWDRRPRPGLIVHESLDLMKKDIVELNGIPVTSAVRTVVDLGASNRWVVESALEQGIRQRHFTLDDVEMFVKRVARRGRRGVGVIRPLIQSRRRWDSTTESELEDRFRRILADAFLPEPVAQFVVTNEFGGFVARADFAYPDARLLIELDSEAHHMDRIAFRTDRSKQNSAALLGWTVLRYTWWDVVERPYHVAHQVASALSVVLA